MRYDFREVDLAANGTWTFITPEIDSLSILPGICHGSYPLGKLENEETKNVISRIQSDARNWLQLDCVIPVKISSRLMLVSITSHVVSKVLITRSSKTIL